MAGKKKKAKQPSAGDYLRTLGDMLVVNPRNSPAATLGGAAYDYAVKSTPKTVVRDIRSGVQGAEDWLRKQNKALRANPVTATLQMLKAGYIDPLADPYRVFKQAATERSRGNESGGAKLAAMVPLAVAGVVPQLRGAGNVATKAGVEAAETAATKAATKTAKKTATKVAKTEPKPRKEKYQAVEPVAERHPELVDVQFPQGAGLGGAFAIANRVPIVGRHPFMAQSNKGYSGLAGSVPANRVTANVRNFVDLPPEVVLSPEEIAKKYKSGIPLIGDKLSAGTATSLVNDRPQVGETLARGGPDWPRLAEALGGLEAWKSSDAVIRALENMQRAGENLYEGPVAGIYTTMGATGLDQSTAMMDLLGRQLAAGGVTKNNLLDFDENVKNILGEEAAKDFTGFAVDPMAAAAQLNDISKVKMPQRTAVQKLLDKASALDQGFPDIGANRVALTVPDMLYAPEGTSGRMISGLSPLGGTANRNSVPIDHPNYPRGMGGVYEGRTEFGLPRELMFSNYFKAMQTLAKKGFTPVQIQAYLFQRTPKEVKDAFGSDPRIQPFDQQWVDEASKYIEDIRKYGEEPYARGGLAVRRRPTPLSVRRSPRPRKSRKA
jgi:hypothetical protein